jgi:hypothetical protein
MRHPLFYPMSLRIPLSFDRFQFKLSPRQQQCHYLFFRGLALRIADLGIEDHARGYP